MNFFTTGVEAVDQMGQLNITGNIKPAIWNETIVNEKGKPQRLSMDILADVAYWYRPTEIRDELSGQVIGWRKRFASDMLQRSYKELMEQFREEKKTIIRAVVFLEELGVIKRVFRTLRYKNGMVANNVMFIDLNVQRLYELTFPQKEDLERSEPKNRFQTEGTEDYEIVEESSGRESFQKQDKSTLSTNMYTPMDNSVGSYGQICREGTTDMSIGYDNGVQSLPTNMTPPVDISDYTNTENTPKTATENTTINTTEITDRENIQIHQAEPSNPYRNPIILTMDTTLEEQMRMAQKQMMEEKDESERRAYREYIKENICLDRLLEDPATRERALEIYQLICDTVCMEREKVHINGTDYPYQVVKSRFLKLNEMHVGYVLRCMTNTTTKITNIRAYLLTALYNAPDTIDNYWQQEYLHDEYGVEDRKYGTENRKLQSQGI